MILYMSYQRLISILALIQKIGKSKLEQTFHRLLINIKYIKYLLIIFISKKISVGKLHIPLNIIELCRNKPCV